MTIYANLPINPAIWIDFPSTWTPETGPDAKAWGERLSRACWIDSGLPHTEDDLEHLAAALTLLVERYGPDSVHPEHGIDPDMEIQTLLYIPDPRILPIPARVMVIRDAVVHREGATLRDLVVADDPEALEGTDVIEFPNPTLGTGLRAFRHRTMEPGIDGGEDEIYAVLKYAFPVPGHNDLIILTVSWSDLGRLEQAQKNLDELAQSITFEYHPDEPESEADA